ncbi:MAG TPA: LysM peptidoglycan-binding domain-containing protein [Thermodesulforhabdus norvegica]|uniref:LysM peptidoglycan-binding domain-containing protein n=1 Tax=Thermodesulforhabdus norvegica TaxID=39841 RepID=A0A7C1B0N5_9BACT|nr:LysM peptidoglycan-binding domain-containing protein [Thermodesulforhabdus norvegica]
MNHKLFLYFNYTALVCLLLAVASSSAHCKVTRSIGYPWTGRLENGIPFPRMFDGYILRSKEHTYTTPEVIGALLDALEGFRKDYPDSCRIYLGDFSKPHGGPWYPKHRSHQNGRDVDIGMFAKNNRELHTFIPMNATNMDVPKTWCFIRHLLQSGMVEKIFIDRKIQRLLYKYARSQGFSEAFLKSLFYNVPGGSPRAIIKHVKGHRDHMHVRFHAPWSELAGRYRKLNQRELRVIEMAQRNFLPKKILVYIDNPSSIEDLSMQLGVSADDLKRWNGLKGEEDLHPGMGIVFYRKRFEVNSLKLAMSLDVDMLSSHIPTALAMLHKDVLLDIPPPQPEPVKVQIRKRLVRKDSQYIFYRVKKGDTLYGIARRYGITVRSLMKDNKIASNYIIRPGQILKVRTVRLAYKKPRRFRFYRIKPGDTLWAIAKRFDTHVREIVKLNGLSKPSIIRPSMVLKIPH